MNGSYNSAGGATSFIGGGDYNSAGGISSFIGGGDNNSADSLYSAVLGGAYNYAQGDYSSVVGGEDNTATAYAETVLGSYSNIYTPFDAEFFNNNDFVFRIGNGVDDLNRSDAFQVKKNGEITINEEYTLPNADGTASGQVLTTDGSGNITWQTPSGGGSLANFTETAITGPDAGSQFRPVGAGNRGIALTPTGIGYLSTDLPDATADGGNSRGDQAIDWQMKRATATQIASGNWSVVGGGENNTAGGTYSIVSGGSGNSATAKHTTITGGENNIASSIYATVGGGRLDTASGQWSTIAGGTDHLASGNQATIGGGRYNKATSTSTTIAGGFENLATNTDATIGGGAYNVASGQYSIIPGGHRNTAASYAETVIGSFSADLGTPNSATSYDNDDYIFRIGNGTSTANRSDIFQIKKNGEITINDEFTLPGIDGSNGQVLTTNGSGTVSWTSVGGLSHFTESSYSTFGGGSTFQPVTVAANASIVIQPKGTGAFTLDQPDGNISGGNARGSNAVDLQILRSGAANVASGDNSIVGGGGNNAATATYSSTLGGFSNRASGNFSSVIGGLNNTAPSYSEVVVGTYAKEYTPDNATNFDTDDYIFRVGNGTGLGTGRSDAFQVKKNGEITFNEEYTFPAADGFNGQVLTTNGGGTVSWANASGDNLGNHRATDTLDMVTRPIRLSGLGDNSHGLRMAGILAANFAGVSVNGPALYGFDGGVLGTNQSGTESIALRWTAAGNIGIGTSNPTKAKVQIEGSVGGIASGGFAFYSKSGFNTPSSNGATANTSLPYSLYASDRIAAVEFNAFSDIRIKNKIGVSDSKQDLKTLMNIAITDYTFRDTVAKGSEVQKKVIAQELLKVYPQAVTNDLTDVVPDIYQLADIENGTIKLATNLKVGEKVKILFEDSDEILEVTAATASSFKIDSDKSGKVFVYGREVTDFHTVDYEALGTLNISATQQLYKELLMVKGQLADQSAFYQGEAKRQQQHIKKLEATLQNLQQRMDKVEANAGQIHLSGK